MLSSVTTNHSQNVYSPTDVDGPDPVHSSSEARNGSAPPVPPAGNGSNLPLPKTTGSLADGNLLELGFALDYMQADMETVMRLFYDFASKTRQAQKAIRHSELNAQVQVLLGAAQKMRDAAEANFKAAIASGVMGIVGGALNVGMNGMALRGAYQSIKFDKLDSKGEMPPVNKNSTKAPSTYKEMSTIANSKSMTYGQMGMGLSQMLTSTGDMIAAGFKREGERATADAKELDALAMTHQALSEHANEWVREMQDLMQDTLQKMAALIQIQHDTNTKILS